MSDLFKDIIPSILQTKKDVLENEKDYTAFVVNRALSYHIDCLMYANQMNLNSKLDSKLQYHYLFCNSKGDIFQANKFYRCNRHKSYCCYRRK